MSDVLRTGYDEENDEYSPFVKAISARLNLRDDECWDMESNEDVAEAAKYIVLREVKEALDFEKISEPPGGERRLMVEFILRWFGEGGIFEVKE